MTTIHSDARSEHPVVTKLRERRTADIQLRIADAITKFAGSKLSCQMDLVKPPPRGRRVRSRRAVRRRSTCAE